MPKNALNEETDGVINRDSDYSALPGNKDSQQLVPINE